MKDTKMPTLLPSKGIEVATQIAETLSRDYAVYSVVKSNLKLLFLVFGIGLFKMVSMISEVWNSISDFNLEKVLHEHPISTLLGAVFLLLYFYVQTERMIMRTK